MCKPSEQLVGYHCSESFIHLPVLRRFLWEKPRKTAGGEVNSPRKNQNRNHFVFLSFVVDPLNWQSLIEIGEMACSTTARCSSGTLWSVPLTSWETYLCLKTFHWYSPTLTSPTVPLSPSSRTVKDLQNIISSYKIWTYRNVSCSEWKYTEEDCIVQSKIGFLENPMEQYHKTSFKRFNLAFYLSSSSLWNTSSAFTRVTSNSSSNPIFLNSSSNRRFTSFSLKSFTNCNTLCFV